MRDVLRPYGHGPLPASLALRCGPLADFTGDKRLHLAVLSLVQGCLAQYGALLSLLFCSLLPACHSLEVREVRILSASELGDRNPFERHVHSPHELISRGKPLGGAAPEPPLISGFSGAGSLKGEHRLQDDHGAGRGKSPSHRISSFQYAVWQHSSKRQMR